VERASFAEGRVSLIPPPNFKPWTKEQIAAKYVRGDPPQYVFANETGTVIVGVTSSSGRLSLENSLNSRGRWSICSSA
jgi:hypothetical protein